MITLRDLVNNHRDIAAITGAECNLLARVLEAVASSWLIRLLLPKDLRKEAFAFRMLAATLAKAPSSRPQSLQSELRVLMRKGAGKRLAPASQEFSEVEKKGAGRHVRELNA